MISGLGRIRFLRLAFLAGTVLCVSACYLSGMNSSGALIGRLKNRGPVALSSENPFLAGNLLIAREMEASPEIKGFIDRRGAPAAIEVQTGWFSAPGLVFYYPENREQYNLERADDAWVIAGPSAIERDKMKQVALLTRNIRGEPTLLKPDQKQSAPFKADQDSGAARPPADAGSAPSAVAGQDDEGSPAQPSSAPFASPAAAGFGTRAEHETSPIRVSSAEEDERLVNDLLKQYGAHQAELTPRGDVVHYVTYPGETLSMIARWYTWDRNNAGRIARINLLRNPNSVSIGDELVIPGYLAKNKNRLTEEAVKALSQRE